MIDCLDSDVTIIKSGFYTYAPYCSPCVPGAGDLNSALEPLENETEEEYTNRATQEGHVRSYCVGEDWFASGKSPYMIFNV
jgi:hypothetical protein